MADEIEGEAIEVNEWGNTLQEHEDIVAKVDRSHIEDYDGSRRRYANSVSTSEALRKRAATGRAQLTNGHSATDFDIARAKDSFQ